MLAELFNLNLIDAFLGHPQRKFPFLPRTKVIDVFQTEKGGYSVACDLSDNNFRALTFEPELAKNGDAQCVRLNGYSYTCIEDNDIDATKWYSFDPNKWIDKSQLKLHLENLISNAKKYI